MSEHSTKTIPVCACDEVHISAVEERRAHMPDDGTLYELADFFKVFGDSTRMRILFALQGEPLCVCDLAALLEMTKSAVSHQLKVLRQSALITYRRAGKNVYYALADSHVGAIIDTALEHIKE